MDNVEHLWAGVACLAVLLQAAPHLKIVATSRERLNLREEWVLVVDGLSYPTAALVEAAETYSAVQLFVQHADAGHYRSPEIKAALSLYHLNTTATTADYAFGGMTLPPAACYAFVIAIALNFIGISKEQSHAQINCQQPGLVGWLLRREGSQSQRAL